MALDCVWTIIYSNIKRQQTDTLCGDGWLTDVKQAVKQITMGANCTVEIDEAKFGKRKYNRGRMVEGQ